MNRSIDLSAYSIRTDLAIEAHEMAVEERLQQKQEISSNIEGVIIHDREIDGIQLSYVKVTEKGAKSIGKKPGNYLTIEAQGIREHNTELQKKVQEIFAKEFSDFLRHANIGKEASCLVVGLGNSNVTPDALGPLTVENLLVTRHLFHLQPESVEEGFRPVSAVAPGVMGTTGIETSDIIHGIVEKIKPDFVIVIDALAARSIERVNATIQISDTGIHPGSGVGNKRKELSRETLGIPVISIGVPTVVDAVSITSDTIDFMLKHFGREMRENKRPSSALAPAGWAFGKKKKFAEEDMPSAKQRSTFLGMIGTLAEEEKRKLIYEVLAPLGHNLMVTPKEVDMFIEDMANLLASGLNAALHEQVDQHNIGSYTH
ncbi:GPR endopeptidase [Parageobacillus thermoglucosidasius]|uniref:Germination protease n=1 Tax=Parageobacillus thermoglucosidasius TaxID=1426 RepID=A0AAN0YSC6_PARTM|nr:GPR endopeptidase [Parageobacillus thermoglucosidasius]KYD13811.1 Endopeptidase spore protease Gpr [Anoxybacillus flavithermus]ALF11580.1 peptidase [Parageobacillus thermoglucosidasius]ANZ31661.1 GPR endopeptidase [Parageobacillus thermoglucosidasius]APM82398.1 GPR endopeptidase [Parageobacillus thermoglucosidasius]EID45373.1 spore protease Gpr [Parageobacillus thermoglucosidasius TNO-09.020]